jgi:hypothetical protein
MDPTVKSISDKLEALFLAHAPVRRDTSTKRYGYSIKDAVDTGWDSYFKKNPHVAGAAAGAGLNGDDSPERYIVVNPYSPPMKDPAKREALYKIEAARHLMAENKEPIDFAITPEMQSWREKKFGPKDGYLKDDDMFKETIVSRALVGDDVPLLSDEANKYVSKFQALLKARESSKDSNVPNQSFQDAVDVGLKKLYHGD